MSLCEIENYPLSTNDVEHKTNSYIAHSSVSAVPCTQCSGLCSMGLVSNDSRTASYGFCFDLSPCIKQSCKQGGMGTGTLQSHSNLVRMVQRTRKCRSSISHRKSHFSSAHHSVCFSPGFPIPFFLFFPGRIKEGRGLMHFHGSFPKRENVTREKMRGCGNHQPQSIPT